MNTIADPLSIPTRPSPPSPTHIYKLVPTPTPTSTCTPPLLPISLATLPLDTTSRYIHLCTRAQIRGVIDRFMKEVARTGMVWVLQVSVEGKALRGQVRWEWVDGMGDGEWFPHLYGEEEKEEPRIEGGRWGVWRACEGEGMVEWVG
ncbi:hypothetical protein BDZ91DRAFT_738759 [Kalaharituber pfeilii]|nr:hypothetical protein BDZ91DRAFT_738759 [Kalaharituber pfeilii]